jgi:hypothetical protein
MSLQRLVLDFRTGSWSCAACTAAKGIRTPALRRAGERLRSSPAKAFAGRSPPSKAKLMQSWSVAVDSRISKRALQDRRPDPDEQEEAWKQSPRVYEEKRRQMARYEWHLYHTA